MLNSSYISSFSCVSRTYEIKNQVAQLRPFIPHIHEVSSIVEDITEVSRLVSDVVPTESSINRKETRLSKPPSKKLTDKLKAVGYSTLFLTGAVVGSVALPCIATGLLVRAACKGKILHYAKSAKNMYAAVQKLKGWTNPNADKVAELIKSGRDYQLRMLIHYDYISPDVAAKSLTAAARAGNSDILTHLLNVSGGQVDQADARGTTPLIAAARNNHVGIINQLLLAQAELEQRDSKGNTALLNAVSMNQLNSMHTLLDANADIHVQNNDGKNALMLALENRNQDMTQILLDNGAHFDSSDLQGKTVSDYLSAAADVQDERTGYFTGLLAAQQQVYSASLLDQAVNTLYDASSNVYNYASSWVSWAMTPSA